LPGELNEAIRDDAFLTPAIDGVAVDVELGGKLDGSEFDQGLARLHGVAIAVG
jgi:hypothetical protein